jgi:hypothetical protein
MSVALAISEYVQAARGIPVAHMALMQAALNAADAGAIEHREGLAVAELFGRFAVSLGHAEAMPPLIRVLFARCAFEHAAKDGDHLRGCHAGAQALRYLDQAADCGDEEAAVAIANQSAKLPAGAVEMAATWQSFEWRNIHAHYDSLFERAARGNVEAGIEIMKTIDSEAEQGGLGDLETLALGENVTRIGAATGDCRMIYALADVMLRRRRYELAQGQVAAGLTYIGGLSISLLAELVTVGHPNAEAELQEAISDVGEDIARELARSQPAVLAGLIPKGSC